MMMILELILELERTYIPLGMAIIYLYGFEKSKVENMIKFFVLRGVLGMVEWMLMRMFESASPFIHYSMIPTFFYLSIYSYTYAAGSYDVLVAPLLNFFIDYHSDLVLQVQRQRNRIKILQQHGKAKQGEINELAFLSKPKRMFYEAFHIEHMYLLK